VGGFAVRPAMEQDKKEGGKGEGKRISICHSIQFFSIKKKIEKKIGIIF